MDPFAIVKILKLSDSRPNIHTEIENDIKKLKEVLEENNLAPVHFYISGSTESEEQVFNINVNDKFWIYIAYYKNLNCWFLKAIIYDLSLLTLIEESVEKCINTYTIDELLQMAYENDFFHERELILLRMGSKHGNDVYAQIIDLYKKALVYKDPSIRVTAAWCVESNRAYLPFLISPLLQQFFREKDDKSYHGQLLAIGEAFREYFHDMEVYHLDELVDHVIQGLKEKGDIYTRFYQMAHSNAALEEYVVEIFKEGFKFETSEIRTNAIYYSLNRYTSQEFQPYWNKLVPEYKHIYATEKNPELRKTIYMNLQIFAEYDFENKLQLDEFKDDKYFDHE